MRNQGHNHHRFSSNPLEQRFAEKWEEININWNTAEPDGQGTLDYCLAEDRNHPMGEVTDRDRTVAATVIQWLGSPCGQCFLRDVLEIDIPAIAHKIISGELPRPSGPSAL